MTYEFDVTAASNPLGTILTTLGDDDLVAGTRFRPVKLGTGMTKVVIHADNPKAAALEDEVFLRIRDTVIGDYIYSGSLNSAQVKLISEKEDHRVLSWGGLGSLGPLSRMTLGEDIYALGPPVQTARGSFDVPGMYTWTNVTYGAIGRRMFEEGRDHPDNPFAGITATFDRDAQTGGAPWTLAPEKHQERVGTNVLDGYVNLIKAGVIFELTPGLVLNSWETFGSDHSGAAFALDVVRFMVGANPLDTAANLLTEVERAWQSLRVSELLVIGADNVTVKVTDPTAPFGKVGVYHYEASSDPAVLTAVGNGEIARRKLRTIGALKLPVDLADDPTNGKYLPGPGRPLWVGNTVSAFTGSAAYDFDAEFPVAALDFVLTDSEGWTCQAELGTPFIDRAQAARDEMVRQIIKGTTPAPHSHPELLCPPAVACDDLTADMLTAAAATNGGAEDTGGGQWSGGSYTTSHKHAGSRSYGALSGTEFSFAYSFDPSQVFTKGTRYVLDVWAKLTGAVGLAVVKSLGVEGVDEEVSTELAPIRSETGADGGTWALHRVCWVPTQDRTGVTFRWEESTDSSAVLVLDDLTLYTTTNNELAGRDPRGKRCDSHERAQDVVLRPPPGMSATNVQDFADEIAAVPNGQFVEKVNGGRHAYLNHGDVDGTETIDLATASVHEAREVGDCIYSFAGLTAGVGCRWWVIFRQDAIGGHTRTLPESVIWPDGTEPAWSTDPDAVDVVEFMSVDGTTVYGDAGGSAAASLVAALDDLTDVVITTPGAGHKLRHNGTNWVNANLHDEPMVLSDGTVMLDSAGNPHMHEVAW